MDDGDNTICSVQCPILPTHLIPRGSPGSQEVWEGSDFFYHYLIWQGTKDSWGHALLQERYARKLSGVKEASVNMLRFWGADSMI